MKASCGRLQPGLIIYCNMTQCPAHQVLDSVNVRCGNIRLGASCLLIFTTTLRPRCTHTSSKLSTQTLQSCLKQLVGKEMQKTYLFRLVAWNNDCEREHHAYPLSGNALSVIGCKTYVGCIMFTSLRFLAQTKHKFGSPEYFFITIKPHFMRSNTVLGKLWEKVMFKNKPDLILEFGELFSCLYSQLPL